MANYGVPVNLDREGRKEHEDYHKELEVNASQLKGAGEFAQEQGDRAKEFSDNIETVMQDGPVQTVNGKTGNVSGLATEQQIISVTQQLADEAKQTEQYQGDMVALIQSYSVLSDSVIVRFREPDIIDIGVFYVKNEATIFTVSPDNDGWYRLKGAITRKINKINKDIGKNVSSTTGVWESPTSNRYTSEVGATFEGEFNGENLFINTYADNNGGVWEITVDGVYKKEISVWSSEIVSTKRHLIFSSLPKGRHTIKGVFKGDDTNNPPSSGTSRGWLKYASDNSYPFPIVTHDFLYEQGTGLTVPLDEPSRKEFAFSTSPVDGGVGNVWIPEHGTLGVMKNIVTKIKLDNKDINSISEKHSHYLEYKNISISTEFDAHHPDFEEPLWRGRLDQIFNPRGFHVRGNFKFLRDCFISSGYTAMLAINKSSIRNNYVITSYGKRHELDYNINDGTRIKLNGEPFSILHFSDKEKLPSGQISDDDKHNTVVGMRVDDYQNTMRLGEEDRGEIFVDLRTDGDRKTYYQAIDNHVANTGDVITFGSTCFIGKIDNPSDILPDRVSPI